MKKLTAALARLGELLDPEDDPREPAYDPVHLAGVLIVFMVCAGVLFWLLWTALVFEGGLFLKLRAGLSVLIGSKTLEDYGYQSSPYAMGAFEGWVGNTISFLLCVAVVAALHRLYGEGARRAAKKGRHG